MLEEYKKNLAHLFHFNKLFSAFIRNVTSTSDFVRLICLLLQNAIVVHDLTSKMAAHKIVAKTIRIG